MPQSGQNLAPACSCLPQLAQALGCAAAVPQLGQNFAPDAIAVPQLAHVLAVPPGEAAVGWVIWARDREGPGVRSWRHRTGRSQTSAAIAASCTRVEAPSFEYARPR